MKNSIGVVGAGFSGLSAAIRLQQTNKVSVTVFDGDLPHEKASKVASGIVHPFPGQHSRPAKHFEEAIHEAFLFFAEAGRFSSKPFVHHGSLYRVATSTEQEQEFDQLIFKYPFVQPKAYDEFPLKKGSRGIEITLSKTIYSNVYLEALENWFLALGGKIIRQQVKSIEELNGQYEKVVVAAGKNTPKLLNMPQLKFHKGQILYGKFNRLVSLEGSVAGKGYLALTENEGYFCLGSTYEHHFKEEGPTIDAIDKITRDANTYLEVEEFEVEEIRASYRVTKKINGIPLVCMLSPTLAVVSCMGSRGLLYHALCAKYLKEAILDQKSIPEDIRMY